MPTQPASLTIRAELCTACMACELACSFVKEGVYSPALSRIQVMQDHETGVSVPIACVNCAEAPCMDACPTQAITRDGHTGIVRLDQEACNSCGACVVACPYGVVFIPYDRDTAIMCDLCGGDPACVPSCMYGAIRFEWQADVVFGTLDLEPLTDAERKRWAVAGRVATRIRRAGEVRS